MKKAEFIDLIAEKNGFTKKEAGELVKIFEEAVLEGLAEDGEINLTGFIKFEKVLVAAKEARNPKTGEKVKVPAQTKIKAKISSSFGR
jgi:DNA-binding protein HU-beta